ncbi:MAG TPA: carboxypeptidase-like regulatory domain-containing protein [Terriglobales bacterium]|jgi:hypothetical protein|nr:carboxypeptidase-like regulatory domain-containing protein [Terriglobales bacterium]
MNNLTIRVLAAVFLCFCNTKAIAQEVKLEPGQQITLESDSFIVKTVSWLPVHGTVRDPQGRPLKAVEVRSQVSGGPNDGQYPTFALTDQSGGFTTRGEDVLFVEKKGYTPSAVKLADKDKPLSLVLVPESKKQLPKCAGASDLPSISVNSLRYSLPSGIRWKKIEGDKPDFRICTVWEQECLSIFAVQEYESSPRQNLPSANLQVGYRVTREVEPHPELADLLDLELSETFKSTSGRDWTNWNGVSGDKPWRWFKGPKQVAWYDGDVSRKSATVFDAIIDSACWEKSSPDSRNIWFGISGEVSFWHPERNGVLMVDFYMSTNPKKWHELRFRLLK